MSDPTQPDDDGFDREAYAAAWQAELGAHVPEFHGTTYAEHRRLRARQALIAAARSRRQAAAPDPNRRA
jgi:hypothetical protein